MEAVSFPSAQKAAIDFLKAALADRGDPAEVGSKVRSPRAPRFVKVTRVGGTRSLVLDNATIAFECWDKRNDDAEKFGALVRAIVGSMDTPAVWYAGEVGGLAFFPDPLSDDPRYQFTALIRSRGEAI